MKIKTFTLYFLIVSCLLAIILILISCGEGPIQTKPISKETIVEEFNNNFERFQRVAEYIESNDQDIFIEEDEKGGYISKKSQANEIVKFEIEDESIKNDIKYIFDELDYKYINENGVNGIYFTRQSSLHFAQGIAYSKNGEEPDWGTIEELDPIEGKEYWYYYKGY